MRTLGLLAPLLAIASAACATSVPPVAPRPETTSASSSQAAIDAALASDGPSASSRPSNPDAKNGAWLGAAAEGDMLDARTSETFVGVWVDVPDARAETRPPMEIALVVDTSGSMAGAKIESARRAAATLVKNLRDGDIVALDAFSDQARTVVPPTRLDAHTRAEILRRIAELVPLGSTNMFAGLTLAEAQMAAAPASHGIRRVVVISDGIANIGPSSPETLGAVAERGLRSRAQVTSLGVGTEYDEQTLNALAVRSSGRLYHLSDPREMASILDGELRLLDATLASEAFVEIVAAPGVHVLAAEGVHAEHRDGNLRIPLGALHAGQHREALVRVRIADPAAFDGHTRPLASVRLRFRDVRDGDLERIQEVVARTQLTTDEGAIARSVSSRTKAIMAITDASRTQIAAAQRINDGNFVDADKELERAQQALAAQARTVTAEPERKRLEAAAGRVAAARTATQSMPAKPKAAQRDGALKLNADAMHAAGF